MAKKFNLITGTDPVAKPPRPLGKYGLSLWQSIMSEYRIADSGGLELLQLACSALDRAEGCRERIDKDGELVPTTSGAREHPLLKIELANRAFVARTLHRLGLDVEAVKPIGRPAPKAWSG